MLGGGNILSADDFINQVQKNTKIQLYEVSQEEISAVEENIEDITLKTVPGTMKLHQVFVCGEQKISYRDVSCTCYETPCPGHELREFSVVPWGVNVPPQYQQNESSIPTQVQDTSKLQANPLGVPPQRQQNKFNVPTKVQDTPKLQANPPSPSSKSISKQETSERFKKKTAEREENFKRLLRDWHNSKSFGELLEKCNKCNLDEIEGQQRYIEDEGILQVDTYSMKLYPSDKPPLSGVNLDCRTTYPVRVRADGNCLPGVGSVFAFGNDERPCEIRARIVKELCCQKEHYVDEKKLKTCLPGCKGKILNSFAMYSDEYKPGTRLDNTQIEHF